MINLMIFINLFFVPILPTYMIQRRKQSKEPLHLSLELLFQYCCVAVCNIPLAKSFVFLIRKITKVEISIDSGYYTLAAIVSAFLIYALYLYQNSKLGQERKAALRKYCTRERQYYRAYLKEKKLAGKLRRKGIGQAFRELTPAWLLVFSACFMTLIFEPLLMYASNVNDFWFDFGIMIWPVLSVFALYLLGGILIVSAVYAINLYFSGRVIVYKIITLLFSGVFFLLYLQGNWLDGELPPLTGEPIVWENYGKSENTILILTAFFISIVVVYYVRKIKLERTVRRCSAIAGLISVILLVSLIPTIMENDALKSKDTFSPTLDNYNTISSDKNFLIFLIDTADSKTLYDVMMSDEEFHGILDDFSYFSDALSVYPFTRDSIPNILTGTVNHNEMDYLSYSSNSYNQSPLFEKLARNGYEINLYSDTVTWGGKRNYNIENSTSIYDIKVDLREFAKQELKYIKFKYFPYGKKQTSDIETLNFNLCKKADQEHQGYTWGNLENYGQITGNPSLSKQEKPYFHFIHCEGVHTPFNMDKNLNAIENGTQTQKTEASLTMIKTYLQRLKDNDAYDNSVIVIMADHGYQTGDDEEPYFILSRCNPALFIKGFGEKHEMIESNRPISYVDLQDAFSDLIDGKQSSELFTNLEQGRTRTALWHIWTEEYHMVEYKTTSSVRETRKFVPTGNVYDLKE